MVVAVGVHDPVPVGADKQPACGLLGGITEYVNHDGFADTNSCSADSYVSERLEVACDVKHTAIGSWEAVQCLV